MYTDPNEFGIRKLQKKKKILKKIKKERSFVCMQAY